MENVEVLLGSEAVEKFKGEGTAIEQQAVALAVVDEVTRAEASDMSLLAKAFKKKVKEKFAPAKAAADKAHIAICALENETIAPADRVIKILDGKANVYLLEQERIQNEKQAKIDAETKRREDAERERLLKLAVKQAENGKAEKAEETLQRAEDVYIPPPILPSAEKRVVTETGSTSSRKDFDLAIVNSHEVIQAIAAGKIPFGVARHDVAKNEIRITGGQLKEFAKMQQVGGSLPVIPGCRLVEKFTFSGRSR